MIVDGKLNCTAYFRSNDILFGFQQVNVFNNTFIQECLAMMLGVKVGKYYHIANNMHFYSDKEEVLLNNANAKEEDYQDQFDWQGYNTKLSFKEFNYLLTELFSYREQLSNLEIETLISFKNDFFDDWAKVFYRFHTSDKSVNFVNPYINLLFNRPKYKPDTKQVKVNQDGFWGVYEVFNEEAYLKKCRKEGKEAHYLGRVDKYGYLNK
jgi:thymidylate synthase